MAVSDIQSILLPRDETLRTAMRKLQASGCGLVIVVDEEGAAIGVLSDGDIRTGLLEQENLEVPVSSYMTKEFVWVEEGVSKEKVLKLFDNRVRAIPILDADGRPKDLATPGYAQPQAEVFARAKAPLRVSLAGGGTDYTGFFVRHGGCSLSTTMAKYCYATLRKRDDGRINICSLDLHQTLSYDSADQIAYDGQLDLLKAAIKVLRPNFGFDLEVGSDFSPGSGLGGSAAVLAAVIGCFNEFRQDFFDLHTISEFAYEAERVELEITGGWQDQYSTVFGGFNFIEFNADKNVVTPLRIPETTQLELEARSLLCYTGQPHGGETIQKEHRERAYDDARMASFAAEVQGIAQDMKSNLLRGDLSGFGRLLHETWEIKKRSNPKVTTRKIDEIYDRAMKAGAEGGRLLGTGGGGYILFFTQPFARYQVATTLQDMGLTVESVNLDQAGLQTWSTRP